MRPIICLIALCVFLTGCSTNGEPSSARIEAALNQALKAKNPEASAKITSLEFKRPYFSEEFTFTCTNCVFEFKDGTRTVVPSCEGTGIVTLGSRDELWKFNQIVIRSAGVGTVTYQSDHIF